jgi:hypothetical protein
MLFIGVALVHAISSDRSAFAASISEIAINERAPTASQDSIKTTENSLQDSHDEKVTPPPTKDSLPAIPKEYKEYLAYQVAEDAKTQLVSWAKWIIGVLALIIAILGVKTYFDVQSKISDTIDKELATARENTKRVIEEFMAEKIDALNKPQMETTRANELISEQTTQASSRIATIVGGLPGYLSASAISGLSRLIYDAQHKERSPYRAKAGCTTSAATLRTRLAPSGMMPALS